MAVGTRSESESRRRRVTWMRRVVTITRDKLIRLFSSGGRGGSRCPGIAWPEEEAVVVDVQVQRTDLPNTQEPVEYKGNECYGRSEGGCRRGDGAVRCGAVGGEQAGIGQDRTGQMSMTDKRMGRVNW